MNTIKTTFYILLLSMAFLNCQIDSKQPVQHALKFDGLYFTKKKELNDEVYRSYLRFYEDGKVIGNSSSGEPHEVIKWLVTGADDLSSGKYLISGNQITFDLKSELGEVSYKGTISANQLTLTSESKINGYKSTNQYKFQNLTN